MLLKFRVFLARYCGIQLRKGEEKTFYSVQILTRMQIYVFDKKNSKVGKYIRNINSLEGQ